MHDRGPQQYAEGYEGQQYAEGQYAEGYEGQQYAEGYEGQEGCACSPQREHPSCPS